MVNRKLNNAAFSLPHLPFTIYLLLVVEVIERKRRIGAVDLRARVPAIARGLALFLFIAGSIFVGVSYYKMRNHQPFRLRSEAPALSKEVTGIINGYEQRITKERSEEHTSELQSRLHLVCR